MADNFLKGLLSAASDDQFRADLKNGLYDLGKGASRSAGQMVTGGVDLMSLLLSPLGYNNPAPVGSTAWAEQKGMIPKAEYTNKLAGLLGEGLGGVAPMVAQAKAPQIANGLLTIADNAAKPNLVNGPSRNQAGAIVWHGSPHKFDKFDSSKIGTGEGAQAYGHGMYLAESPAVANSYAKELGELEILHNGKPVGIFDKDPAANAAHQIRATGGDLTKAVQRAQNLYTGQWRDSVVNEIQRLGKGDVTERLGGNVYKVDLPDEHIAKMLDWDKPLNQQAPAVRIALTNIAKQDPAVMDAFRKLGPNAPANQAYAALTQHAVRMKKYEGMRAGMNEAAAMPSLSYGQDAASALMKEQGISGIRYLDGGSRGAGAGSSNFVVFPGNEDMLKILERNGQPVNALKGLLNP